jgi:hypothetical protein
MGRAVPECSFCALPRSGGVAGATPNLNDPPEPAQTVSIDAMTPPSLTCPAAGPVETWFPPTISPGPASIDGRGHRHDALE